MPAVVATCDPDGVPNVMMVSQVHYVDPERVALSYQFFNKTRSNMLSTRRAAVSVVDPLTNADYRLELEYEGTEAEGPLFESMKAKLAGIASHTGMQRRLPPARGRHLPRPLDRPGARPDPDAAAGAPQSVVRGAADLGGTRRRARPRRAVRRHARRPAAAFRRRARDAADARRGRMLRLRRRLDRLRPVGHRSELALGAGVVGVAARERAPIRISHMSSDYSYGAAVREQSRDHGLADAVATEIPYPGLEAPESQIAVPILAAGRHPRRDLRREPRADAVPLRRRGRAGAGRRPARRADRRGAAATTRRPRQARCRTAAGRSGALRSMCGTTRPTTASFSTMTT